MWEYRLVCEGQGKESPGIVRPLPRSTAKVILLFLFSRALALEPVKVSKLWLRLWGQDSILVVYQANRRTLGTQNFFFFETGFQ